MRHPECSQRVTLALRMCDHMCREKGFKSYQLVAVVTGEQEVSASKWRALVEQKTFRA